MAKCTAITRAGSRCQGVPIDGSGLCHAHHPDRAQARKQAGYKGGKRGGRGRPLSEVSRIQARLEELAEAVLTSGVGRAEAAVAGQLYNYALRAIQVGLKAKEVEELEQRVEQLEAAAVQKGVSRQWGYTTG